MFGRVSEHGLLTSVQELDDLIANVQMPTVIEVQAIFEDEFVEHIRGNHPKNIYYIHTSGTCGISTLCDVTEGGIRIKTAGNVIDRILTEVDHITDSGSCCENLV